MNRIDSLNALDLNNHGIEDDEIDAITKIDLSPS